MVRYTFLLLCLAVLGVNDTTCQDRGRMDSLAMRPETDTAANSFHVLYELAFQHLHQDNERALGLIKKAQIAAQLSGDSVSIVKSMRVMGQILLMLERTSAAVEVLANALPIAKRNLLKREQYYIESSLGRVDVFAGRYDSALKRYYILLSLVDEFQDGEDVAHILHSIGLTYYKLKDYQTSLNYYKRSLDEHSNGKVPASYYANIALCYAHLGELANARSFAERSLRDCGSQCAGSVSMNTHYALGVINLTEGKIEQAEKHFHTSYELAVNSSDSRFQLDNICLLADIYLQQDAFTRAERILLVADSLIDSGVLFNLEKIKVYSRLSTLYLTLNDYLNASRYQSKYIVLKDSVYNEELTTSLMRAEAAFLGRENESKLNAQSQIIALNEQVIARQNWLNVFISLAALLGITLSVVLYRSQRRSTQLNKLLDRKIKERTDDLEAHTNELLASIKRERFLKEKMTSDIRIKVTTLKGLCGTARSEVGQSPVNTYIERVDNILNELSSLLNSGRCNTT